MYIGILGIGRRQVELQHLARCSGWRPSQPAVDAALIAAAAGSGALQPRVVLAVHAPVLDDEVDGHRL